MISRAQIGQIQARARDGAIVRRPPAVHAAPEPWQHEAAARDLRGIHAICRQRRDG